MISSVPSELLLPERNCSDVTFGALFVKNSEFNLLMTMAQICPHLPL